MNTNNKMIRAYRLELLTMGINRRKFNPLGTQAQLESEGAKRSHESFIKMLTERNHQEELVNFKEAAHELAKLAEYLLLLKESALERHVDFDHYLKGEMDSVIEELSREYIDESDKYKDFLGILASDFYDFKLKNLGELADFQESCYNVLCSPYYNYKNEEFMYFERFVKYQLLPNIRSGQTNAKEVQVDYETLVGRRVKVYRDLHY
ncbi:hypothetical protein HYPBUDRAFT_148340 [Hyphopichia burtonii NRRL Y-1933]|uniref:Uncharacterized protein n=1 Tax=Hyphopichia burtonii NRRL Y-1933 TaxID=984485 RepID=A0A1E4RL99_9ASCO|nr:hypothetical protein HYPBUDRAFT_148340 [Hyphopichia burtonii NRRL Y-1933]ODV68054.1 hypothetical protein HYPBUDRAFT_148340 [Hyphopichia burtonii NRRL Y-1933]